MKKRYASLAALMLFTPLAHAQDFNALARELHSQGFEDRATIRVRGDRLYVETSGSAGRTERVYSIDGTTLLEEETRSADGRSIEREYDIAGNLLEEEIEFEDDDDVDDDDHDDDDDEDDEDDDDDDEDEDDDDDDEDEDNEDENDDDEDDDDEDEDEDNEDD